MFLAEAILFELPGDLVEAFGQGGAAGGKQAGADQRGAEKQFFHGVMSSMTIRDGVY